MTMTEIMVVSSYDWASWAAFIMRISLGPCFVIHALGKLGYVGPGGSMEGFTGWLKSLGLPFPKLNAYMAMLAELFGGIFLTLGLLTRPACAVLFIVMLVAAFLGHKGGGYLITNNPPGNEYALNLAIMMVVLYLLGPGVFSLDMYLF